LDRYRPKSHGQFLPQEMNESCRPPRGLLSARVRVTYARSRSNRGSPRVSRLP
jgi:hypothetical protein